jgi:hypothetical protein
MYQNARDIIFHLGLNYFDPISAQIFFAPTLVPPITGRLTRSNLNRRLAWTNSMNSDKNLGLISPKRETPHLM